jgi:pimeloyl-ACP methyl ester carboxylesterase
VRDSFRQADRAGLRNAVVSISLRRPDLTEYLSRIAPPTLFITGSEHPDWTPERARTDGRLLPNGSVAVLDRTAHLGPLEAPDECARMVREFWVSRGAPMKA